MRKTVAALFSAGVLLAFSTARSADFPESGKIEGTVVERMVQEGATREQATLVYGMVVANALRDLLYDVDWAKVGDEKYVAGLVASYQRNSGVKATGVMTEGEIEDLQAFSGMRSEPRAFPEGGLKVALQNENVVFASGTWAPREGLPAVPMANTAKIECSRDAGECVEALASLGAGPQPSVSVGLRRYRVAEWKDGRIVATEAERCGEVTLVVDLTGTVSRTLGRTSGEGECLFLKQGYAEELVNGEERLAEYYDQRDRAFRAKLNPAAIKVISTVMAPVTVENEENEGR